jgi:signal peptidase II
LVRAALAIPDQTTTRRWLLFGGLALAVLIADQLSKTWIDASFAPATTHTPRGTFAAPTSLLGDLVRIAKTYNSGGIFGLFGAGAPVLALASVGVIGAILYYQARSVRSAPFLLTVSLGLLLGGALGNFIDRIRYGYVIDFVDMGIGDFRWYTFNVADASISLAIVGLIAVSLLGDRPPPWRSVEPVASPRPTTEAR